MFARLFFGSGSKAPEDTPQVAASPDGTPAVAEATGDLFKYYFSDSDDVPPKFYLKQLSVTAVIVKASGPREFAYVMRVQSAAGACLLEQDVHPHMQLETYEPTQSFVWTSLVPEGPEEGVHKWSLVFTRPEQKGPFLFALKRCMFEVSTQMPFQKVKVDDQDFCLEATACSVAPEGAPDAEDADLDYLAFSDLRISETPQERHRRWLDEREGEEAQDRDAEEEEADGQRRPPAAAAPATGPFNSLLVDSARHKKTFVVRGDAIGVFNRGDDCDFDTELGGLRDLQGKGFTPSRVMLHAGDSRLLMLNGADPSKVFPLDLETGKVVEEWNVDKDAFLKVVNFTPSTKHGHLLDEATFVAMTGNVVVGLDPRLTSKAKAIGNPHEYVQTSNPGFTCCATTAKGHLAVGTAKGEIKFFVGVPGMPHPTALRAAACPKTAKTLLPGLGDEIIGLDLTADGAWVLATCRTYLLVICTLAPDAKSTGFETRLGKDKPRPRRLCLEPEDQQRVGRHAAFTPASFNWGKGELYIVTSMGAYIITWNFRQVQRGNTRAYVMKRTTSQIVSEQFFAVLPDQEGYDAPIVLAHPNDVKVEKRQAYDRNPCAPPARPVFDRSADS